MLIIMESENVLDGFDDDFINMSQLTWLKDKTNILASVVHMKLMQTIIPCKKNLLVFNKV